MSEKETKTTMIHIDDKYAIKVMDIEYALVWKTAKSEKTIGYFASIAKCLTAYINEHIHEALEDGKERQMRLEEAVRVILNAVADCERSIREAFPDYKVVKE